ncbi:metal-sulfur cluster assembly factor [Levilactobacillus yiduensis]|uniref:metal-sulfur cluster assembly factor n=1 Tax=Levilactobacillus yiduensis TaxID=2953880 RepID=UPI000EF31C35|nr:metal-sulfur cluster assembly factor [Levilactobacillus yiduensis]AYM01624.1 metal-sulfur cluster assembly factor [Levilactobacillus brevis]
MILDEEKQLTPAESQVMKALEMVIDPELGIDLVNLGLIYDVTVTGDTCRVDMTLTTMGCPLTHVLDEAIKQVVTAVEGVEHCEINLVWEPAWDMAKMTRYAKVALGIHE